MPKAFPIEFRNDVVAVARKREAPIARIAKDFRISESCLHRWMHLAGVEDVYKEVARRVDGPALTPDRAHIAATKPLWRRVTCAPIRRYRASCGIAARAKTAKFKRWETVRHEHIGLQRLEHRGGSWRVVDD
jgi:transposase